MALLCGPRRCRVLLTLLASLLLFGAMESATSTTFAEFQRWWGDAWPPSTGGGEMPGLPPQVVVQCHLPILPAVCIWRLRKERNNYLTKEKCLQKCADIPGHAMDDAATSSNLADSSGPSVPRRQGFDGPSSDIFNYKEYCAAKVATRPCLESFPRWCFDAKNNSCDRFIYGGCWGNKNNYLSEKACLSHCLGQWSHPALPRSIVMVKDKVLLAIIVIMPFSLLLSLAMMSYMKRKFDLTFCSSRDNEAPLLRKRTWRRGG